jgi:hypothetical protein
MGQRIALVARRIWSMLLCFVAPHPDIRQLERLECFRAGVAQCPTFWSVVDKFTGKALLTALASANMVQLPSVCSAFFAFLPTPR